MKRRGKRWSNKVEGGRDGGGVSKACHPASGQVVTSQGKRVVIGSSVEGGGVRREPPPPPRYPPPSVPCGTVKLQEVLFKHALSRSDWPPRYILPQIHHPWLWSMLFPAAALTLYLSLSLHLSLSHSLLISLSIHISQSLFIAHSLFISLFISLFSTFISLHLSLNLSLY